MRIYPRTIRLVVAVALLLAPLAGCGGSATKRDAKTLKRKCDVVAGHPVSEDQARCIAKIYGIRDAKRCPMQVDRPDGYPEPVYRVHESCNGLGAVVSAATGRVLAITSGDEILYD